MPLEAKRFHVTDTCVRMNVLCAGRPGYDAEAPALSCRNLLFSPRGAEIVRGMTRAFLAAIL